MTDFQQTALQLAAEQQTPAWLAALREQGYEGQVIGLTAATIGEETDKMLAAGANAVLSKPVNIKELTKLVASFKS